MDQKEGKRNDQITQKNEHERIYIYIFFFKSQNSLLANRH